MYLSHEKRRFLQNTPPSCCTSTSSFLSDRPADHCSRWALRALHPTVSWLNVMKNIAWQAILQVWKLTLQVRAEGINNSFRVFFLLLKNRQLQFALPTHFLYCVVSDVLHYGMSRETCHVRHSCALVAVCFAQVCSMLRDLWHLFFKEMISSLTESL